MCTPAVNSWNFLQMQTSEKSFSCVCLMQVSVSESGSMTAQLNVSTYYGLVKLLATCAGGSASVAENLLTGGLPDTIRCLLRTSTLFSSSATSTASVLRTNDQLLEVLDSSA